MPLFLFHHFVSFGVEVHYFYDDVKNQKWNMQNIYTRVNQKRSKVHEESMSHEHVLNFDQ